MSKEKPHAGTLKTLGVVAIFLFFISSLFLADTVTESETVRQFVEKFGYIGIFALSIFAGLNLFVPVPAGVFVPIFTAAGYPIAIIIVVLVIGTVIADTIGFYIGVLGRDFISDKYPKVVAYTQNLAQKRHTWVLPFCFLYAAFSPIPNEAIMIPLALLGFKYRKIIIPFILGTIVYQTALAYGVQNISELFF